ncbi:MAG: ribosomal L7Ae/L30e/S12e/Gadd45 family protein, partial [Desulfuromonadales bacterium]|nr:ribosomal L7Ae/L30e/S12e/Gadd45 family protein [Desulfuromonadales bacterium]
DCLQVAVKKNAFQRSFKGRCNAVDVTELQQRLDTAINQKITGLIGMARKSGQFTAGTNAVIESLRKGSSFALVIIAEDISVAIGKKIEALVEKNKIYGVRLYNKQAIGQMLGKEERSVIAIPAGLLADSLLKELHRHRQLVREN